MVLGWNGDLKGLDLIYNKLLIMGSETNLSTILLFQFHEMGLYCLSLYLVGVVKILWDVVFESVF